MCPPDSDYDDGLACAGQAKTGLSTFAGDEPRAADAARGVASVGGIPDDCKHVRIILTGGFTKVGVKLLGAERRVRQAERDIILARGLALFDPAGAAPSEASRHLCRSRQRDAQSWLSAT